MLKSTFQNPPGRPSDARLLRFAPHGLARPLRCGAQIPTPSDSPGRVSKGTLTSTRSSLLLLSLSLLLVCGAGDLSSEAEDRVSTYTPRGAFGAFLAGRFAAQRSDLAIAAE